MNVWRQLTLEQFAVMIVASEEGYLDNVLDEYGMRLQWAQTGNTQLSSDLDDEDKASLIPRFIHVIEDLVARGWLEVYIPYFGAVDSDASKVTEEKRRELLSSHRNWMEGPTKEMIGLMATAAWDDTRRTWSRPQHRGA